MSDSKRAKSSNTIDELKNAIKTLEANTVIGKLAEKDDKIRELREEIEVLKQAGNEPPSSVKFIC